MRSRRREPSIIALRLLNTVDENDGASKWDLTKVVGNTEQFRHWVDDFLVLDGILVQVEVDDAILYRKSEKGELFHQLLKRGDIMKSLLRVSGKRLKT